MVYIRAKKVKGIDYAYLVRSEWDNKKRTSRQVTIKYLGKASDVDIEDIPEDFRNDSRIMSFLSEHNPKDIRKKATLIEGLRRTLFRHLSSGDIDSALRLYENSKENISIDDFYDKVLRPVMYLIGDKWEKKELDIATEHVSSNTTQALITSITHMDKARCTRRRIFLCCPSGELHRISTMVLESILKSKGYRVINASPSVPPGSILHYIGDNEPDLVMISVTLSENIGAAKRLVREISTRFGIPIIVGGLAFRHFKEHFPNVVSVSPPDNSQDKILRLVRSSLKMSK